MAAQCAPESTVAERRRILYRSARPAAVEENDRLPLVEQKLEYAYRLARIYDEMGNDSAALRLYDATIKIGTNRPEYYAARAALQAGYIYEKAGDKQKARQFFQTCLDMEGHDYKNSLDQRAKSGMLRLDGK